MLSPFIFILSAVSLSLGQIRANLFRSFLTTLGIIIGVASVTAVIAAITGLRTMVLSEFETFGANKVFIFPDYPDDVPRSQLSWSDVRLKQTELDAILAECPSVRIATPSSSRTLETRYGDRRVAAVEVTGIWPTWHEIERRSVIRGRQFTATDEDSALPVCIVNDQAIGELDLPSDPLGEVLLIDRRRFTIVGVVETLESALNFGPDSQAEVMIPFSTMARMRDPDFFFMITALVHSPEVANEAAAEIRFVLRNVRRIEGDMPDTFGVEPIDQYIDQFKRIAAGITAIAGGIVAVSLLVGGIGIMNIMLVSVSERTREIGLRKAVGATPRAILVQFLLEAVTLSLLGGVAGVAVGQGMAYLLTLPENGLKDATVPAWAVIMAFGFSATVGIIFGIFPALKAARLDPITALRSE
ncbi:MAG: ABC transporter permease [Phycisphaerales bacterium]